MDDVAARIVQPHQLSSAEGLLVELDRPRRIVHNQARIRAMKTGRDVARLLLRSARRRRPRYEVLAQLRLELLVRKVAQLRGDLQDRGDAGIDPRKLLYATAHDLLDRLIEVLRERRRFGDSSTSFGRSFHRSPTIVRRLCRPRN